MVILKRSEMVKSWPDGLGEYACSIGVVDFVSVFPYSLAFPSTLRRANRTVQTDRPL